MIGYKWACWTVNSTSYTTVLLFISRFKVSRLVDALATVGCVFMNPLPQPGFIRLGFGLIVLDNLT